MRIGYRLEDSGARALITNAQGLAKLAQAGDAAGRLALVLSVDGPARRRARLRRHAGARVVRVHGASTPSADDPALMVYTSGTTGPPKGALHAHRVLLGHLPGIEFPHEFLPQPGDRFWTPADWAWAGGLLNVLLPGLHYGVPVVAARFDKFDPEEAFALMARLEVRNAFIPPTALRMLRSAERSARASSPAAAHRSAPAARRSAPRRWNGAARRSGSRSTSSTARPNATW